MEKHTLSDLVEKGLTQREMAVNLGVSQTNVRYWLDKYGLVTILHRASDRHCRRCGEKDESKLRKGCRYICKTCDTERTVDRLRDYKKETVEYKGGKCVKCGYSKCFGAMDFHHLDPKKKDPNWKRMKNRKLESVIEELDKCILVCKNCHAEIHYAE